jgi:DNA-binding response OmpR family regulator
MELRMWASNPEAIPVLSISFSGDQGRVLRGILEPPNWNIREAAFGDAAAALSGNRIGVMICDAEVPDGDWKNLLRDLQGQARPPNLIVSSRLADDRLWAEVLNLGGYDVLARPFNRVEVIRVVQAAWRAWNRAQAQNAPEPLKAIRAQA